jgi:hypothetical protein
MLASTICIADDLPWVREELRLKASPAYKRRSGDTHGPFRRLASTHSAMDPVGYGRGDPNRAVRATAGPVTEEHDNPRLMCEQASDEVIAHSP